MVKSILLLLVCLGCCFAFDKMKTPNVTLVEWPYANWLYGPPCPPRHQQKLVPIDTADIQLALEEVRLLSQLVVRDLDDIGITAGFSVGVVYDQQTLLSEGFGTINKNENNPPSDTTIYNIGSVTKIFTSLSLYHSVAEGLVELTDPVTKFFNDENPPVFSIHNPYSSEGSDAVTLHSLAAQASGLPREPFCGAYPVTSACANDTLAAEKNLEHLSDFGLLFSPFTGSHYSNLGLALLGRSLERVWGQKYEDYMVGTVFPGVGMTSNTGFSYTQEVKDNMATGYVVAGPDENGMYSLVPAVNYNHKEFGWAAPAGGAYTNRQDMISFIKWIFNRHDNDSLLTQSYLDDYLGAGMLMANAIEMYGRGTWEIYYANGYWTITKGGLTASMATSITLVPELKLGVTVMVNINSGFQADGLSAKINQIMVPAILEALNAAQSPLPLPSNYETFLGSYGYDSSNPYVTIELPSGVNNGVLTGLVLGVGHVHFIWDSAQDTSIYTAFRYSSTNTLSSCMSKAGSNNAIVYLRLLNDKPFATLSDQNLSLYNIPMIQ